MSHLSIFNFIPKILILNISIILSFLLAGNNAEAQNKPHRGDTLHLSISGTYALLSFGAGVEYPFKQSSIGFKTSYTYTININQYYYLEYKHYSSRSDPGKHFYFGGHVGHNYTEHHISGLLGEERYWEGEWYRSRSLLAGPLVGFRLYSGHKLYWDIFFGLNVGYRWGHRRWDVVDPRTFRTLYRRYEKDSSFKYGVRIGVALGLQFYRSGFFKKKLGSQQ